MDAVAKMTSDTAMLAPGEQGDAMLDPLDHDLPADEIVVTTRRGLTRLALVATEVATRFQREAVGHDPMSWLLAPRRLFGGAPAVIACLARDACLRGVLLHGLSLGLDADPRSIDALVDDDVGHVTGTEEAPTAIEAEAGGASGNVLRFPPMTADPTKRLFTATIVAEDGVNSVQAFHASLASDEDEIKARLRCRIGPGAAGARIVAGFDPSDPMVEALVAPAICDTLHLIDDDPASPLAAGLDLNVEQRFRA